MLRANGSDSLMVDERLISFVLTDTAYEIEEEIERKLFFIRNFIMSSNWVEHFHWQHIGFLFDSPTPSQNTQ